MEKHRQTVDELEQHLRDQLQFLTSSTESFDRGFLGEAKRIAVCIRILFHDTKSSKSLLGQLGRKLDLFISTADPQTRSSLASHSGLVVTLIGTADGATYAAFLDDGFAPHTKKSFADWWGEVVFVDSQKRELSRGDLVLSVADQDGGAHVDPSLDSVYADLSRNNSLGWTFSEGEKVRPLGGPQNAALRQIGHEVLKSLIPGYEKKPTYPSCGVVAGGFTLVASDGNISTPPSDNVPARAPKRLTLVGRNELCPCASGLKFKRCCGR